MDIAAEDDASRLEDSTATYRARHDLAGAGARVFVEVNLEQRQEFRETVAWCGVGRHVQFILRIGRGP